MKTLAKPKSKARLKWRVVGTKNYEYGKFTTQAKALKAQLELAENGVKTWLKRILKPKTKKNKLDKECQDLWRKIKLYDAKNKCELCYKKTKKLDVHHIYTRSLKHLKFDLDNGCVLCAEHHTLNPHISAHKAPNAFRMQLEKIKGKDFLDKLQIKAALNSKPDLDLTLLYLENEAKKRGIA